VVGSALTVVLPNSLRESIRENRLINELYLTDIGYYPRAGNHFRRRKEGAEEYTLIYCLEGDGYIKLNRKQFHIKPNSYFIIPAGIRHEYGSEEQQHWSI
jgi:AraC family transcriptional regulator of arabinose operon